MDFQVQELLRRCEMEPENKFLWEKLASLHIRNVPQISFPELPVKETRSGDWTYAMCWRCLLVLYREEFPECSCGMDHSCLCPYSPCPGCTTIGFDWGLTLEMQDYMGRTVDNLRRVRNGG